MGDYADMILDGECCEFCGEFLEGEALGYPGLCPACAEEERKARERGKKAAKKGQSK